MLPLSVSAFQNRSRGKIGKSVCASGTPPDFVPATSSLGPGWNPGRASRASKVAGAFLVLFWRAKENISSATLCFVKVIIVERCASGTNPFRHFALRNATSPEGGGLGKEGRSRPYSSTTGRSLPLSGKLFASAKASPFRERWHGEAVTERVIPPTAKKPACPLPFYGADKLAFVFLFRGRAYSSILPKPRPSKSSTRSVRLGATGSALAASRGA